jgi:iron complex transport system ATP-binding protein
LSARSATTAAATPVRGEPLLSAENLAWTAHGCPVLSEVSLTLSRGESVALIGPNGAGKTTLLRLLAGLLAPSQGTVRWQGQPLARWRRRDIARRIAYVPQARPLHVPLTVEEVVLLGRFPDLDPWRAAPSSADRAAVDEALARTGIPSLRHRPLDELSGGERQLAYLASALAQDAELLLLDEPTTHLDPRHQVDLAAVLQGLRAAGRPTLLLTTHELAFAAALADRVVALAAGRKVADGPPGEVLSAATLETLFGVPFELAAGSAVPSLRLALPAAPPR